MDKDKIFFGEKGLTSTSANHIANMAKEMYQSIEKQIENPVFYNTTVATINSDNAKTLQLGKGNAFLNTVENKLVEIAELKSLIAWLREAIKARENMVDELKGFSIVDYCDKMGVELPKEVSKTMPVREEAMTEDDYYGTLSLAQRNRYYELETKAAILGKYIHENGAFSKERQSLLDKIENPTEVDGNDANALVYSYAPSVSIDEVDYVFFSMQATYRQYQAELNSMKFACEKACRESELRCDTEYKAALDKWQEEFRDEKRRVNDALDRITEDWKMYVKAENEHISNLKIVIPDSLKKIYGKVNSIGKEK